MLQKLQELFARVLVLGLVGRERIQSYPPILLEEVNLCFWFVCVEANCTGVIFVTARSAHVDLL